MGVWRAGRGLGWVGRAVRGMGGLGARVRALGGLLVVRAEVFMVMEVGLEVRATKSMMRVGGQAVRRGLKSTTSTTMVVRRLLLAGESLEARGRHLRRKPNLPSRSSRK